MMNSLPVKKRDPGAPMITSEIGGMSFTRSLLDSGASINILPKAVFNRHLVGELQPFLVELSLADGSFRKPHGLVEDVIIRIEDCYFSIDFLVVDMKTTKELSQAPIILGRPFLATAKSVTDWGERRSNSQGGRAHREGRHQQINEIPFTSFWRLGRYRLRRRPGYRRLSRGSYDDRWGSTIWGASDGRANFGAQNSPVYTQVCLPWWRESKASNYFIQVGHEARRTITGSAKEK